jgi:ABC-type antimicrobial peptide transport system permease subunit
MLTNYLKTAIRSFKKQKLIFLINLFGLAFGMATLILILLWVADEWQVNRGLPNGERIVQIMTNHDNSGGMNTWDVGPGLLPESLGKTYAQVEMVSAGSPFIPDVSFKFGENEVIQNGKFVDPEFFDIFSLEVLEGKAKPLEDINSIALSESMAVHLFGSTQAALGKTLDWKVFNFSNVVQIESVFKDFSNQTIQKPEFLLPFDYFRKMLGDGVHWDNHNTETYILLTENTDLASFNAQIESHIKSNLPSSNVTIFAQPYEDRYLYAKYEDGKIAGGRIDYVKLFLGIACFILIIACINFVNLATARAMTRQKEIGVKKTLGVGKFSLWSQFLTESLLLSFFGLALSLLIVFLVQPFFNNITAKEIGLVFNGYTITFLLGVWLVTGFLAGIYPSFYLTKFKPIAILKGQDKGSFKEMVARKGLVVFQFTLSLLLIIGVLVLDRQMDYIQNQNLGYQQDHLLEIKPGGLDPSMLQSFLNEARKIQGVVNASSISHPLVGLSSSTIGLTWEGKDPEEEVKFENITVDLGLIETMGFEMSEGRAFSAEFGEENTKIILNEAAVRTIGIEDIVGKTVNLWGADREVIGVVKDFHFESLKETVKPAFLKYETRFSEKIMVRINAENQKETIRRIEEVYSGFSTSAMDFSFMDEDYQSLYIAEKRTALLTKYFGAVAIFLSCLGLFGLVTFTAERRKKEIGVRKVMGASTFNILGMITKDFVQLVFWALCLGLPIGWYFSSKWLQTYAFQTNLSWWIFVGSGAILMIIALATVGFQAFKAASTNPVNSLSSE